jgi:rare lipoprotein A
MGITKIILFSKLIILLFVLNSVAQTKFSQTGMSSYYGKILHGNKTASGEKYDTAQFTAAHKTLPFQSLVKVTNLKNKKSVIVRINDRGPYSRNRIIDLSQAAAEKIDMIKCGIAKVKIEVIEIGD